MYSFYVLPRILPRRILNGSIRKLSTVPVEKAADQNIANEYNDLEGLSTVVSKNRVKLPQREPFVKNLFLGIVDTEILTYPELTKKDVDELETTTNILLRIKNQQDEPKDVKEAFRRLKIQKCLGLQCPTDIGGRELNQTEKCRINEILLDNRYRYNFLNNELCINLLSEFGTDEQKSKYLQKLLNGEVSATISIANNSVESDQPSDDIPMGYIKEDLESYILKGKKKYIINGENADLFIIFVRTGEMRKNYSEVNDFSAFIVDKDMPGVSIEKIDVNDSSLDGTCNLIFNDVWIPKKNILQVKGTSSILSKVLPEYHLDMSVINLNILRKLVNSLSNDLLINTAPGEEIYQTEAVTSIMSEILSYTYMVESMVYLTSGLMSTYENQDCDMECMITRGLSSELAVKSTVLGMSLIGTPFMDAKHFCRQLHKEAITQYTHYENENMAKLLIGLFGIQHSGKNLGQTVKKLRNPMFHGTFILKRLWQNRKQNEDNPDLTLGLKNYLHPSCQDAADHIEYCVLRLQYATESLLGTYGMEVLNCHNHLRRLSESVMHIYAMISCLSRASRSYCVGLEHNETEMVLANVICQNSYKHVRALLNDVIQECEIMDLPLKNLSESLYNKKNYFLSHPLSRNF